MDVAALDREHIVIRPYEPADEPAVVHLWEATDLTRPWNDPRKDIARKLEVQREWFLVALCDHRLVGTAMAGYDGHRGWVNYLAVDPDAQGQGIGRALMEAVEQSLRAAGCPKLNLQVRRTNEAAVGFYESLGYERDEVLSFGRRLVADE